MLEWTSSASIGGRAEYKCNVRSFSCEMPLGMLTVMVVAQFLEIFTKVDTALRGREIPCPLPPNTSTLDAPSATKTYNIIGRSMEQLVVKF